jgi:hypothetical protein
MKTGKKPDYLGWVEREKYKTGGKNAGFCTIDGITHKSKCQMSYSLSRGIHASCTI